MENWLVKSSKRSWDNSRFLGDLKGDLKGEKIRGTLRPAFYERDTLRVARELLGKVLVVRADPRFPLEDPRAKVAAARIVETEAYHGTDPASHSCRGETPRTAVMFGPPGRSYVYLIYGNYEMLNFVTEKKGYPGAVLIRAVEPLSAEALMRRRTGREGRDLANGPGKLCQALGVKRAHNGETLWGPSLFVVDTGVEPREIFSSSRVGLSVGMEREWRFFASGSPFVSRSPLNRQGRKAKSEARVFG